MSRHWVSTQSHPKHHTSKVLILLSDHRYPSTRWNPYTWTPFSLGNGRSQTVATARQDSHSCLLRPTQSQAARGAGQVAVTALTSSCCSPAWACSARSPGGRNLLWCFCVSGWMYLLCALCCVCLDVELWCLSSFHPPPACWVLGTAITENQAYVQHMRPHSATGRGRQICSTPCFCVWMAFYPIHPRTSAR